MHIYRCIHTYVYIWGQYVTYTPIYRVLGYCSAERKNKRESRHTQPCLHRVAREVPTSNSSCELETHSELYRTSKVWVPDVASTFPLNLVVLWKILCDITRLEDTVYLITLCPHCQREAQLSDLFASFSRTM